VTSLLLVLVAPGLLLGLAFAVIEVMTVFGGCPPSRRYRWLHTTAATRRLAQPGGSALG